MDGIKTVNIIGAGLAGLSAAITLAENGVHSNLISSQPSERAQSVLAEGGINAALDTMGEGDTTGEHFADTMRGGCFLESESAVKSLTENAPGIVTRLYKLGVPFENRDGRLVLRNFGGQKKKRTAYAKSSTGKMIMTALIDEARKYEAAGMIDRMPHHTLVGIKTSGGALESVTVKDNYTGKCISIGGNTVLCTGGLNGFFDGMTTGTTQNTGDAAAIAFAAGAAFADLEFIQYHPTTAEISGKRMLISEAARGEGGRLFIMRDGKPWYFMEERYPSLGNLMPRDVVAREMTSVKREPGCDGEIFLDMTGLGADAWTGKLSDLRTEIISYLHMDPKDVPVPVRPGIHFFMGGIRVNDRHETDIKGLFAAGEAACRYHGANRLGGNSMLAAIYGGSVAARSAAETAGEAPIRETDAAFDEATPSARARLKKALTDGLGIIRDEASMKAAEAEIEAMTREEPNSVDRLRAALGLAMIRSAIARRESRGAHFRSDIPDTVESLKKKSYARYDGGRVIVGFDDGKAR